MNRFQIMFSPIDTREAQVQPMEEHSDPVSFSGPRPYQVLSSASAVICCPMLSNVVRSFPVLSIVFKRCQGSKRYQALFVTKCCQVLTSKSQPGKTMAPKSHTPTNMTSEQNRETLRHIEKHRNIEKY